MDLCFERLEDRKLLAASVSQRGSTLTINGDNADDSLTIESTATGEVVVTDNTTGDVDVYTNVRIINVNTRGGDDTVEFIGGDLLSGGRVSVNLGSGDDTGIVSGDFSGSLTVDGGIGLDTLDLTGLGAVDGSLTLRSSTGGDEIALGPAFISGNLSITTSTGEDIVTIDGVSVDGTTRVSLGTGDDQLSIVGGTFGRAVTLDAGAGDDFIDNAGNTYDSNLTVNLNAGDDSYAEIASFVDGNLRVNGGAGDDDFDGTGTTVNGSTRLTSV
jgi:large repetitive protein